MKVGVALALKKSELTSRTFTAPTKVDWRGVCWMTGLGRAGGGDDGSAEKVVMLESFPTFFDLDRRF